MNRDAQRGLTTEPERMGTPGSSVIQSSAPTPRALEVHIDELVLHGFAPGDRHRIGEALELELTRLFVEQGVPPSLAYSSVVPHLDGGAFEVPAGSKVEVIAARIAQALYGGLMR